MLRWAIHPRLHEVQFLTPPPANPKTTISDPQLKLKSKLGHYRRHGMLDGDGAKGTLAAMSLANNLFRATRRIPRNL